MENNKEISWLPATFYTIGIVILIFGIIQGWKIGETEYSFLDSNLRNWQSTYIVWASTLVSGVFFFGFGKIIELLVKIYNRLIIQTNVQKNS